LLADIAGQAGAAAYAVRLTTALQRSRERLVLAREEERRRIRRDLHDELGPSLASQTLKLDAALESLETDPAAAASLLQSLKTQNQELIADIRRLVYALRPPSLDELGLSAALQIHAGAMAQNGSLAIAIMTIPDPLPALPAAVEVAAYRMALEAITNVTRYARAQRCAVRLEMMPDRLTITISDDGIGLPSELHPGVGLTSMRERAEELGGQFEIGTAAMGGVLVTAVLPLVSSEIQSFSQRQYTENF
jgi:signal transduction histidine kinase